MKKKQKSTLGKDVLIIFILLICFQYGCVTDNKYKYQAYQDIKELVLDKEGPRLGYFLFFPTRTKNKIAYREASYLQSEFHDSPKFKGVDIESFFKDIVMGDTILSCGDLVECFTLSSIIMDEYKKKKLEEFAKVYAIYNEKDKNYIINQALSDNEKLTVAYCFYLNNIYTVYDCYSFDYISRKVPLYTPVIMSDDLLEEIKE